LVEHADDRHHGQPAVRDLRCQLLLLPLGAARREDLPAVVPGSARLVVVEAELALYESDKQEGLHPADGRNLGQRRQAVRHVCELDALRGREFTFPPVVFRRDVTHASDHADSPVLKLHAPSTPELLRVSVCGKPERIPEADGWLHAKLPLEGSKRRIRVKLPIPPRLARETVLVEHADDGHHGEPAVRKLGVQLPRSALAFGHGAAAVRYAQNACILKISWFSSGIVFQQRRLQNATEAKPLEHARSRHLGKRRQAVRHLLELQAHGRR